MPHTPRLGAQQLPRKRFVGVLVYDWEEALKLEPASLSSMSLAMKATLYGYSPSFSSRAMIHQSTFD